MIPRYPTVRPSTALQKTAGLFYFTIQNYYVFMMTIKDLPPALVSDLTQQQVNIERTLRVLELIGKEADAGQRPAASLTLPSADDPRISDMTGNPSALLPIKDVKERLEDLQLSLRPEEAGISDGDRIRFDYRALRNLGIRLYPRLAVGVLNGGMATSYTDIKKNRALNPEAFTSLQAEFERLASDDKGKPKGICGAYIGREGEEGASFMLLKMRSLLINALEYRILTGDRKSPVLPFFQMTSTGTDAPLKEAYERYRENPLISGLIQKTGIDPTKAEGRVQDFLAALTHSSQGFPRRIFSNACGRENKGLALPGGHGENFRVLAPVYRELRSRGIRFVYLGNVDNLGYTVDPAALGLFALRGGELAFEFSWKTAVDIKGGVLTENSAGILNAADIGQAIGADQIKAQEDAGGRVLFNCATGIFDLDYLTDNIDTIKDEIPIRLSDQDKEAGRYAQAEQTTWEILSLVKNPLIFAVAKEKRFIAAKMLMETLMASPVSEKIDQDSSVPGEIKDMSRRLREGLGTLLERELGFSSPDSRGKRAALSADELEKRIRSVYE
ncbi:UTP--glucose-1-phosphate uridylyltransferase [Treponema sp. OttesenSCG-928-L16]|nr:UTP--glucose-1-phosphate uridylyltransferase [Treponema sp. OttesenSCG-928-L16]